MKSSRNTILTSALSAFVVLSTFVSLPSCESIAPEEATLEETDSEDNQLAANLPEGLFPIAKDGSNFFQDKITISLTDDQQTKTTYVYEDGLLKTSWKKGDVVAICPSGYKNYGALYAVASDEDAANNIFTVQKEAASRAKQLIFLYPGDQIASDIEFVNFSYVGQVQKKSDPMGHLGAYHTMRKVFEYDVYTDVFSPSEMSFKGCDQSGCMRFVLSGRTFVNPQKLTLSVIQNGIPVSNILRDGNYMEEWWTDPESSVSVNTSNNTSTLTLDLEGYETESSLTAYMMLTNADMTVPAGSSLRVTVYDGNGEAWYSDVTLSSETKIKGGNCSTLTIKKGWTQLAGDYSDYSWDGEVVTLQEASNSVSGATGLDLVIMGDGFIKEDFDNGTYESLMLQAYNEFFSVLPLSTMKKDFNVYYVKAPSPQRLEATNTGLNGAQNSGNVTKFSTTFTPNSTSVSGNDALVREYAKKAFATNADERIKDATIIVMANQACRAGTCHNSYYLSNGLDYGQASAVAYCALGTSNEERIQLIHHEVDGHGFGKLADEYYYETTTFNYSYWDNLAQSQSLGLFKNVDKYVTAKFNSYFSTSLDLTNDSDVLWYDMLRTKNNYESSAVESLGMYEGGYTYDVGFCRPTSDGNLSIMNQNTGYFNAICRRQIYYRYRRLKGEVTSNIFGTSEELNAFLDWDAATNLQSIIEATAAASSVATKAEAKPRSLAEEQLLPFAPPVMQAGEWRNGRFVPNSK